MNGAELRCAREFLGLGSEWVAEKLGCSRRSITRWESGEHPVPDWVSMTVTGWLTTTERAVGNAAIQIRNKPAVPLTVWHDKDNGLHDRTGMPASWYRLVAARAAGITGGRIEWVDSG